MVLIFNQWNGEKMQNEEKAIKNNITFINLKFSSEIICPACGFEVDLWSHEEETLCHICGYKFFQKEKIIH